MKRRLLSLITAQRVLCVLALSLPAEAAHAQTWAVPYNFDYVGTWAFNHNLSRSLGRCVNGLGGCTGVRKSSPQAQAAPRGTSTASLYTGEDFATRDGIKQLVSPFPAEKQPELAKLFVTLILSFNKVIPATYGIPKNNLATAYAAVLAGGYAAYTNRPFPDNAVRPLFKQAEQAMLNNPVLSTSVDEKNANYQLWVGVGTYMLAWQDQTAKHPNPQEEAKLQEAGANILRSLGFEPDRVRFTASGMELHAPRAESAPEVEHGAGDRPRVD